MYLHENVTIIDSFLSDMDVICHSSQHTVRAYRNDLAQVFNKDYLHIPLDENLLIKKIKSAQMSWAHYSLATRQRKAATMKSFLRWLFERNLIMSPLQDKIEAPKVPQKIPHYLSIDEVLHLFNYLEANEIKNNKNKYYLALLFLLYGGGLRVSEACRLTWKNIRSHSSEILIFGKGQKERWVVLPLKATKSLLQLPKVSESIWGPKGLSERQAYQWIRNLGKNAGLKTPLHPHALRHSYATHLITAGMNLRTLQELMGHSSLTATEKYLHLSMDQLARTIDSHHPLGGENIKTRVDDKY